MSKNFEKIKNYLLENFSKREGTFGYKPRMHPIHFSTGEKAHQQLLNEGLIYLENEQGKAIASLHPKRGITFNAVVTDKLVLEECRKWKVTITDDEVHAEVIDSKFTTKGIAVLGELDLSEVIRECGDNIYFQTYDEKLLIQLEDRRSYPDSIYAEIVHAERMENM